jgi:hypothetical protein
VSAVLPRCEQCNQPLSCETDWLGRMHYLHTRPASRSSRAAIKWTAPSCGKRIEIEVRPRSDREYSCGERCTRAIKRETPGEEARRGLCALACVIGLEQQQGAA